MPEHRNKSSAASSDPDGPEAFEGTLMDGLENEPPWMTGHILVIGNIWMPNTQAAYDYSLRDYDIDNMRGDDGKISRSDIERWLNKNAGDFQSIEDFSASIGDANYGWKSEESELLYNDLCFGEE